MRVATSTLQNCDTFVTDFLKMQHLPTKSITVFFIFRMYLTKSILFVVEFRIRTPNAFESSDYCKEVSTFLTIEVKVDFC